MTDALSIVRNRTTTQKHDEMRARERADAERRRAELDQKRAVVKANPVGAKLHQHALGGVGTHAAVVIKIVNKDGSVVNYMTCELSVDSDGLTLIVCCPSCIFRHHRPMSDSQITLRSWHRKFALLPDGQGEFWASPKVPEVEQVFVTIAGVVETIDVQTCPVCNFRFHLEKSKSPSERGITVIREV